MALALNACVMAVSAQEVGELNSAVAQQVAPPAQQTPAAAVQQTPRLVVQIVVEELRSDYLHALRPLFGTDGFARFFNEGFVAQHYGADPWPIDRASQVATISTGATAADHGIASSYVLNRATLRRAHVVDDAACRGINTALSTSPQTLRSTTLADELKQATNGAALAVSLASRRDMAVLSAGHAADMVLWLDAQTGQWATTTYYGAPPAWLSAYNREHNLSARTSEAWTPATALAGSFRYLFAPQPAQPFLHKWDADADYTDYLSSALSNEDVLQMAVACFNSTLLGMDNVPDLLCLSLSAANYKNLPAHEAPVELQDAYVRLDRVLARLLKVVDEKVGLKNTLIVLTSTGHDAADTANPDAFRLPSGTFSVDRAARMLNMYLAALHGAGQWVEATVGTQFYLNRRLGEDLQINHSALCEEAREFLAQLEGVRQAYTQTSLLTTRAIDGDVFAEIKAGWKYTNETTREESPYRAASAAYPIIFLGQGVRPQQYDGPVGNEMIAPTLAACMRIRGPNASVAQPLPLR